MKINVSFAATVTCMLILDSSGVCAVALFCCFVHEAAHILCMLVFGEKPSLVELSFYGIKLERNTMSPRRSDIPVYAAGPAANLLMSAVLFALSGENTGVRNAAVISLVIGLFNLLPCRPLDGGNILFEFLCRMTTEEKAEKICDGAMFAVLVPMALFGFAAALEYGNVTIGGAAVYLGTVGFLDKKEKGSVKL